MKYLQDSQGRTITIPDDVQLFKRVVLFTGFSIAGDFSSDFEVANNSETRSILSIYGINQIDKLIQKPFHFFIDGNRVSDGRVFIRGVGDTIDLFYVAGNGNWMNQVTGSLKDVDLSDFNVAFNAPTIISRMTATEGVIFPVMDWCYNYRKLSNQFMVSPISGISIDTFYDFYACFHVKTILKRLINSYGYILAGNLLDDVIYNSLIITPEEIQSAAYSSAINTVETMQTKQYIAEHFSSLLGNPLEFVSGSRWFSSGSNGLVASIDTTDLTLTYTVVLRLANAIDTKDIRILVYKNAVELDDHRINGVPSTAQIYNHSFVIDTIAQGDVITFEARRVTSGAQFDLLLSMQLSFIDASSQVIVKNLLPNINQIDFIKYVAQRFNCLIDFSEQTQTLTFTMLDTIRREDAVDMTANIVRYEYVPASGYAEKNYVRTTEADELVNYKSGALNYGDALVESNGDGEQDVLKTPFRPAETFTAQNLEWLLTSVPLVRLEDADDGVAYVNVQDPTGASGKAEFVNAQLFAGYLVDSVVRIESDSGEYSGFAVVEEADNTGLIPRGVNFGAADTGRIYKQKIVFLGIGSRELIVCRGVDINDINVGSQIYGDINLKLVDGTIYPIDSIAWAFHAKPNIGTDLDLHRVGLNYGPVTNTGNITFGQKYHKNFHKVIRGSHLQCEMRLSQAQFKNLDLKRFVYLSTKDATGYFFIIDFQDGYTDQFTPVQMDLVYMGNG